MRQLTRVAAIMVLSTLWIGCGRQPANESNPPPAAGADTAAPAVATNAQAAGESGVKSQLTEYTPVANLAAVVACSMDEINHTASAEAAPVKTGGTVTFRGWATDGHGNVPTGARMVLAGPGKSFAFPLELAEARPDVADALKAPAATQSGFNVSTELKDVPAGNYHLFVEMGTPAASSCDLGRSVVVTE